MGKVERLSLYLPVALSAGLYIFIGYFLERHQSFPLLLSYILIFASYVWLTYKAEACSVKHFIIVGFFFRLLLLFTFPNLSDDIYRFVWDGKLIMNGIHPFSELPSTIMQLKELPDGLTPELYASLNSPDYFTIYPSFAQLVFWLSVAISTDSLLVSAIVIRVLIILTEIGTIYFLLKLADYFEVPKKNIIWYVLNPLVILELTGNLHFEAFMLFFIVASIYSLLKNRIIIASLLMALAISAKLIPLLLLPLFIKRLKWSRLWKFFLFTGLFTVLAFLPLLNEELIQGMSSSISLYFQSFEFNASIYYLIRAVGFQVKGYNIIGDLGPFLAMSTFIFIMVFAVIKHKLQLPKAIVFTLMIYFLFATTVHPWYIITVLAFSVLTTYRFAIVWSFLIFFTYLGYSSNGFNEKLWVTIIEYGVVIVYMLYEIFKNKKQQQVIECA